MTKQATLTLLHLVTLLLACTGFTLVTGLLGRTGFNWSFVAYCYSNGWGYTYHSDYSLLQVLAYLMAYGSGLCIYLKFTRPSLLSAVATLVCIAGLFSFGLELTHWFFAHHLSLIASFPVLLLLIGTWNLGCAFLRKTHPVAA